MKNSVIEWAPFRVKPGVDEGTVVRLAEQLQTEFLARQPGYQGRELLKGKTAGEYVDLVRWDSMEDAERAAQEIAGSASCQAYFAVMEYDPSDASAAPQHFRLLSEFGTAVSK